MSKVDALGCWHVEYCRVVLSKEEFHRMKEFDSEHVARTSSRSFLCLLKPQRLNLAFGTRTFEAFHDQDFVYLVNEPSGPLEVAKLLWNEYWLCAPYPRSTTLNYVQPCAKHTCLIMPDHAWSCLIMPDHAWSCMHESIASTASLPSDPLPSLHPAIQPSIHPHRQKDIYSYYTDIHVSYTYRLSALSAKLTSTAGWHTDLSDADKLDRASGFLHILVMFQRPTLTRHQVLWRWFHQIGQKSIRALVEQCS